MFDFWGICSFGLKKRRQSFFDLLSKVMPEEDESKVLEVEMVLDEMLEHIQDYVIPTLLSDTFPYQYGAIERLEILVEHFYFLAKFPEMIGRNLFSEKNSKNKSSVLILKIHGKPGYFCINASGQRKVLNKKEYNRLKNGRYEFGLRALIVFSNNIQENEVRVCLPKCETSYRQTLEYFLNIHSSYNIDIKNDLKKILMNAMMYYEDHIRYLSEKLGMINHDIIFFEREDTIEQIQNIRKECQHQIDELKEIKNKLYVCCEKLYLLCDKGEQLFMELSERRITKSTVKPAFDMRTSKRYFPEFKLHKDQINTVGYERLRLLVGANYGNVRDVFVYANEVFERMSGKHNESEKNNPIIQYLILLYKYVEDHGGSGITLSERLGSLYFANKDYKTAKEYLIRADTVMPRYLLGKMFELGLGVQKDLNSALEYYKKINNADGIQRVEGMIASNTKYAPERDYRGYTTYDASSSYSIGGSGSGSAPTICTTAICKHLGMKTDCREIKSLYELRDNYMYSNHELNSLFVEYLKIGKRVLLYTESDPEIDILFKRLFDDYISPITEFVAYKEYKMAFDEYCIMMLILLERYGLKIPSNVLSNPYISQKLKGGKILCANE